MIKFFVNNGVKGTLAQRIHFGVSRVLVLDFGDQFAFLKMATAHGVDSHVTTRLISDSVRENSAPTGQYWIMRYEARVTQTGLNGCRQESL